MRRFIHLGGFLILGLALSVPSWAAQEKKERGKEIIPEKKDEKEPKKERGKEISPEKKDEKDPKKEPTKGKDDKGKIALGQSFDGKLTQMDSNSSRDFTVQVKVSEPNPDGYRRMQELQFQLGQQQQAYARARNLQERQNAANQIQNTQIEMVKAKPNMVRYKDQDVKLRAAETMKVRSLHPPLAYDDKGNVKQYTSKELKELQDTGLPGYRCDNDALRTGQIVRVYLAKTAAPIKGVSGKGASVKGKKIEDDLGPQDRPEA